MNNKSNFAWSNLAETNQVIESTKAIKIIEESEWEEAGLNKKPAALKTKLNEEKVSYYLNYFAVMAIQNRSDLSWNIPTVSDWKNVKSNKVLQLKEGLMGNISPRGKMKNESFSNGFWTTEKQGENHAFYALFTNLNDTIYVRSDALSCGFFLRLVRETSS